MVKMIIFKERGRSMSRKNHEMIDGKLLQTDKKYAQLKLKQKEKLNVKKQRLKNDMTNIGKNMQMRKSNSMGVYL